MSYKRTVWKDHVTEYENRYREEVNADGSITHVPVEGEVIQQGTPMSATNFNNLEEGTQEAFYLTNLLYSLLLVNFGHTDWTLDTLASHAEELVAALQTAVTEGTITAAKAATLTATLGISLGGTGATTAAAARTNLSVPSTDDLASAIKELRTAIVLADAENSVKQAIERDHEDRIATIEAQLAAMS